ncbi:hypothetical protein DFJ73DRAFT_833407 [Zopfochytrium polystomum]|nr:hypothetical protein DFJ73DRAFT_833407 [Zopfochytrium polystomum]
MTSRDAPPPPSTTIGPWQAVLDEREQSWYWWNTVTGETTWDTPKLDAEQTEKGSEVEADPATPTMEKPQDKEPDNDRESEDDDDDDRRSQPDGDKSPNDQSSRTAKPLPKAILPAALISQRAMTSATSSSGPAEASQPSISSSSSNNYDYYSSKEYYDWYYAQYAAASAAAGDPTAVAAQAVTAPPGVTLVPPDPSAAYAQSGYQYASAWSEQAVGADFMQDHTLSATFNAKTGRFQVDRNASYFDPIAKAERQMSHYFDVNAYQEERNRERQLQLMQSGGDGTKKKKVKLTRKELERIKEKNKAKKYRSLVKRLGDD